MFRRTLLSVICAGAGLLTVSGVASAAECPSFLNQDLQKLHSKDTVNICKAYAGKPLLIVNTASHCGFTPQFKGLQSLYEKYQSQGLVVIGFASNDFHQEAKDAAEAAEVCYVNYGVKFTMIAESSVMGATANPIFKELARQTQAPKWNFNKYVVQPDGKVIAYFSSTVTPDSADMTKAVEQVLASAK
jgi:glutathione peroxidase